MEDLGDARGIQLSDRSHGMNHVLDFSSFDHRVNKRASLLHWGSRGLGGGGHGNRQESRIGVVYFQFFLTRVRKCFDRRDDDEIARLNVLQIEFLE